MIYMKYLLSIYAQRCIYICIHIVKYVRYLFHKYIKFDATSKRKLFLIKIIIV